MMSGGCLCEPCHRNERDFPKILASAFHNFCIQPHKSWINKPNEKKKQNEEKFNVSFSASCSFAELLPKNYDEAALDEKTAG